ncbi:MAG: hypothetical protein MJ210_03635 [Alphaproteobacteria bacterium]|nr:hypothetical protein [Alphaproteobacteria bacterium]
MYKHIENVEIVINFSPDNELVLFIRENDIGIDHLIYRKQFHIEKDNTAAQLVGELYHKRELGCKELANILGVKTNLKKKINKAFDFLPKSSIKSFFPVLTKNKVKFTPKVKLTDFISSDTNVTFKSRKNQKQSLDEYEEKIACYLFNVHIDGSYELERSCQHNFMEKNFFMDFQFYDKDNFDDWKLFTLPKNLYVNLMWLSPIPELDALGLVDTANTSTLSDFDVGIGQW